MSNKTLVTCGECDEYTPVVYRTDYLGNGVQHIYAVCQSCGARVTVYYTDKEIRRLLKKQERTLAGKEKEKSAELINDKMQKLRERIE